MGVVASLEGYFLRVTTWFERLLFLVAAVHLSRLASLDPAIDALLPALGLVLQKLRAARGCEGART